MAVFLWWTERRKCSKLNAVTKTYLKMILCTIWKDVSVKSRVWRKVIPVLFGRKTHKELETLYTAVRLEANNNYKDAAQEAYRRFEQRFIQLKEEGQE